MTHIRAHDRSCDACGGTDGCLAWCAEQSAENDHEQSTRTLKGIVVGVLAGLALWIIILIATAILIWYAAAHPRTDGAFVVSMLFVGAYLAWIRVHA